MLHNVFGVPGEIPLGHEHTIDHEIMIQREGVVVFGAVRGAGSYREDNFGATHFSIGTHRLKT